MTNSLSQPYKSKDFKIFLGFASGAVTMLSIAVCNPITIMEATGLEPVTRNYVAALPPLSYASIWKWALSVNPLEALDSYSVY